MRPLDILLSGSVDLLEINKVPTPDMPGDAVGGSVDVRSGSTFARKGRGRFDYRAEMSYNQLGNETNPAGGVNFSAVFSIGDGVDNLGVFAGIDWQKREFESDNLEAEYALIERNGADVLILIVVYEQTWRLSFFQILIVVWEQTCLRSLRKLLN